MTKRILSLVLAALTAFALCAPALASGEPVAPEDVPAIGEAAPELEASAEPAVSEPEMEASAEPDVSEPAAEAPADEPEGAAAEYVALQIVGGADKITVTDKDGKAIPNGGAVKVGSSYHFALAAGYTLADLTGATAGTVDGKGDPTHLMIAAGQSVTKVVVTVAPAVKLTVKGETGKFLGKRVFTKPYSDGAFYTFDFAGVVPGGREVDFYVEPGYELAVSGGTITAQDNNGTLSGARAVDYIVRTPASGAMTVTVSKIAGIPFTVKGSAGKVTVTDQDGKAVTSGGTILPDAVLTVKPAAGYAITGLEGLIPASDAGQSVRLALGSLDGTAPKAASVTVADGVKLSVTGSADKLLSTEYTVPISDRSSVSIPAADAVGPGSQVDLTLDGDYAVTVKNGTVVWEQYALADPAKGTASAVLRKVWVNAPKSGTMTVGIAKASAPAPKPIPVEYDDPENRIDDSQKKGTLAVLPGDVLSVLVKRGAGVTAEGGTVTGSYSTSDGGRVYEITVDSAAKKLVIHTGAQKSGWVTENGQKYYYQNGLPLKGLYRIPSGASGKVYCFSETDGHMLTGAVKTGDNVWQYFSTTDGHMMSGGWIKVDGKNKYYAAKNGALYTGYWTIGSKSYYFSVQDCHLMKGGVVTGPGGKQYYVSASDGHAMKGGWARGKAIKTRPGYSYYYYLDTAGVVRVTQELPTSTKIGSLAIPKPSEYQK